MKFQPEKLFYETLNVEFNLGMWVRNLVKYGDFFLFNDVSPEFGIMNVFPIAISEIEREEGFDPSDPMAVRFRWITQGNKILENWQKKIYLHLYFIILTVVLMTRLHLKEIQSLF